MKRIFFYVASIAVCTFTAESNVKAQDFYLGVEGTPQMSWLVNRNDINNKSFDYLGTFSGSFGINGQVNFTPSVGVAISAIYSIEGQRFELSSIERRKRVDYVKIPLLFAYNFAIMDRSYMTIKLGPQLGILANAKLKDDDRNDIKSDMTDAYEPLSFGGVAMFGAGFNLSDNVILETTLRVDGSFTNIEDHNYRSHLNQPDGVQVNNLHRAATFPITAGLNFSLKYLIGSR